MFTRTAHTGRAGPIITLVDGVILGVLDLVGDGVFVGVIAGVSGTNVGVDVGDIVGVVDIVTGGGEQWNRAGTRYRDHTAEAKYHVVKVQS